MESIVTISIAVLAFFVALNMLLTFKLLKYVDAASKQASARNLEQGEHIPNIQDIGDNPTVLIYLDSRCPKCVAKIPELESLEAKAKLAGVSIRITGMEKPRRLKQILRNSALLDNSIALSPAQHFVLNPFKASPFYLFIDEQHQLQASGLIGDANWLSFAEQMAQVQEPSTPVQKANSPKENTHSAKEAA